jgi:hypothetical protein
MKNTRLKVVRDVPPYCEMPTLRGVAQGRLPDAM